MYAVFENGGKQYAVTAGKTVKLEKFDGKVGDKVKLENVIVLSDEKKISVGEPYLNAVIDATIVKQEKAKKVIVFKFKAKKDYRRKRGHRQFFTEVFIDSVSLDGKVVIKTDKSAVIEGEEKKSEKKAKDDKKTDDTKKDDKKEAEKKVDDKTKDKVEDKKEKVVEAPDKDDKKETEKKTDDKAKDKVEEKKEEKAETKDDEIKGEEDGK